MQGRALLGSFRNVTAAAVVSLALSGCLMDEEEPGQTISDVVADELGALTISGAPPNELNANSSYEFTPTVNNAAGDSLSFSVTGLPAWANFDAATGRISGLPGEADVGTYTGIAVTVTDGFDTVTLGPFSVTIQSVSVGAVTLSWTPPTENTDGSTLVDLAGYRIYWGTSEGSYPNSIDIDNPSISTYVLENLSPGTYRFVATSLNASGMESDYTNPITKQVM